MKIQRYCGRDFSNSDLDLIRQLIAEDPKRTRAQLSRLTCQRLNWYKADGGLKDMSARVAMLRMQDDGLIQLPPPRYKKKFAIKVSNTANTDPCPVLSSPVHELPSLRFVPVVQSKTSQLWNEYIHRYHYIGYSPLPGAQLRYFIKSGEQIVALLSFSASAWQTAPRDKFIGWTHKQRKKNLHLIVNNSRFLILPWVQSKNLASKILSMAARRLQDDWEKRYKYRPVLLETFVEADRFRATSYKAANWRLVGTTKGRGKLGPAGKQSVPFKNIWLYPLDKNYKNILKGQQDTPN